MPYHRILSISLPFLSTSVKIERTQIVNLRKLGNLMGRTGITILNWCHAQLESVSPQCDSPFTEILVPYNS